MNAHALRAAVIATARAMNAASLNRGKAGNVSVRCEADGEPGFLITPTGLAYEDLEPEDIVAMRLDGSHTGRRLPSSEWRFHRDIYRARAHAGAIVHAHAPFATALACLRRDVPPFHYMIARFGGDTVRCANYATFGTQALSDCALAALEDRCACLLANHGMIVFGEDLAQALELAVEFEALCEQYWRACTIGTPVLLDAAQMAEALEKFKSYGRQS